MHTKRTEQCIEKPYGEKLVLSFVSNLIRVPSYTKRHIHDCLLQRKLVLELLSSSI